MGHLASAQPLPLDVATGAGPQASASSNAAFSRPASARPTDHRCPLCGKYFTRKSDLSRHYNLHTGNKPLKCLECDYSTDRRYRLKNHCMRLHNLTEDEFVETYQEISRKLFPQPGAATTVTIAPAQAATSPAQFLAHDIGVKEEEEGDDEEEVEEEEGVVKQEVE